MPLTCDGGPAPAGAGGSQPRSFGKVDAEAVAAALVAAGHLGRGVTEWLLDVSLVHLSAAGEAGAQGVAGVELYPLNFWQVRSEEPRAISTSRQPVLPRNAINTPASMISTQPPESGVSSLP